MSSLAVLRSVASSKLIEPGLTYVSARDDQGRRHFLLGPFLTTHDAFSAGIGDVLKRIRNTQVSLTFDINSSKVEVFSSCDKPPKGKMNYLLGERGQSYLINSKIPLEIHDSLLVQGSYREAGKGSKVQVVGTPATVSAYLSEVLHFSPTKLISDKEDGTSVWLNENHDSFTAIVASEQMQKMITSQMNKSLHLNSSIRASYS